MFSKSVLILSKINFKSINLILNNQRNSVEVCKTYYTYNIRENSIYE